MTWNKFIRAAAHIGMAVWTSLLLGACGTDGAINTAATSEFIDNTSPSAATGAALPVSIPSAQPAAPATTTDTNEMDLAVESAYCSSSESIMQFHLLALVNAARSQARTCGNETFAATDPLTWDPQLFAAASDHSDDMAAHNFFSHTGSDGSSVADRISSTGYSWRTVGENIAAGRDSAVDTVSDWLDSAGHCKNLMNPDFTEMAVACVESPSTDYQRYWTNTLGSKQ